MRDLKKYLTTSRRSFWPVRCSRLSALRRRLLRKATAQPTRSRAVPKALSARRATAVSRYRFRAMTTFSCALERRSSLAKLLRPTLAPVAVSMESAAGSKRARRLLMAALPQLLTSPCWVVSPMRTWLARGACNAPPGRFRSPMTSPTCPPPLRARLRCPRLGRDRRVERAARDRRIVAAYRRRGLRRHRSPTLPITAERQTNSSSAPLPSAFVRQVGFASSTDSIDQRESESNPYGCQ